MRILITAGPTREAIDPVRYLSNRSSGRMGFALATAAAEAGHEVVLIAGPTALTQNSAGVVRADVVTAQEMFEAVQEAIGTVDVAVMAAAVSDYRPREAVSQKIKKTADKLTLELVKTPDILGSAREKMGFSGVLVGFAAETENLESNARAKLAGKGCDMMIANDVSRPDIGFDVSENELLVLFADGKREELAKASKEELARTLVKWMEECAQAKV